MFGSHGTFVHGAMSAHAPSPDAAAAVPWKPCSIDAEQTRATLGADLVEIFIGGTARL